VSEEQAITAVGIPQDELAKAEAKVQERVNTAQGLTISERGVTFPTVKEAVAYAEACYRSNLLPQQIKNGAQAFALMAAGLELGLKPWAAWRSLYLTKAGRVALQTKGALGLVRKSGLLADYKEWTEGSGETLKGCVMAKRVGQPSAIVKEFSWEDAKTAKLLEKRRSGSGGEYDSTYDLYLKDMLISRARGRVLDEGFSDVTLGIPTEGIAEDADAAEQERRGSVPVEAKPVVQGPDPLLQQIQQNERAPRVDPALEAAISQSVDEALPSPSTTEGAPEQDAPQQLPPPAATPAPGPARERVIAAAEKALGVPPPGTPAARAAEKPAAKTKCERCGTRLNELGGCELCGWPGKDLR